MSLDKSLVESAQHILEGITKENIQADLACFEGEIRYLQDKNEKAVQMTDYAAFVFGFNDLYVVKLEIGT